MGTLIGNRVTFFVATGTHRKTSEEEFKKMLGEEIVRTYRVVQNDASAPCLHSFIGSTKQGKKTSICVLPDGPHSADLRPAEQSVL